MELIFVVVVLNGATTTANETENFYGGITSAVR